MNQENMQMRTVEHSIPIDILNDLLTRFLVFVPESAKQNMIRICFQIELAHWFYLDFYVANDISLKACSIHEFAAHVFQHLPFLQSESHNLPQILEEWREYKLSVPTYGAIILSENLSHVLLVQSYWAKTSWGFPKGKVNEEEEPAHCAIREVLEETGFDISPYLKPDEYLESVVNEQMVRLYIIKNVPLATEFKPKTRCEIKSCTWFAISDLPNNKKDFTPKAKMGVSPNSFFMVLPFVKRLKAICSGNLRKQKHKSNSESLNNSNPFINSIEQTPKYIKSQTFIKSDHKNGSTKTKQDSEVKQSSHVRSDNKTLRNNTCIQETETKQYTILKKKPPHKEKHSKRQLFAEDDTKIEFNAPSWCNFKFDTAAILECLQ